MRYRIRHHQLRQLTPIQLLARVAAQNSMRHYRNCLSRAVFHNNFRSFDERAAGVSHIIDDNCDAALDIADEDHTRDFVGPGALFMNESEAKVEAVGY